MESAISQPKTMTDWNTWSNIIDAAQDPRHRDAVQTSLAQVELSADVPAAIDEKLLAPRRASGATREQCAYVFCNLGFAALVAGTRDAAEFAVGCGRLVRRLAPESADLALRSHFLFAKSALMLAVLSGQPHLGWDTAAQQCIAFLRAIQKHLDALPADAIEANALAAYSFGAQLLSRIHQNRTVGHYAAEVSQLVTVALALADRLPTALAGRIWNSVLPGTDAGVFFRQVGASAEKELQVGADSVEYAEKGVAYADAILSGAGNRPITDLANLMQTRAELLQLAGRHSEAAEQIADLENLPDPAARQLAVFLKARLHLQQGSTQVAAELLAQIAPTVDQALESWRASWSGVAAEGHWTVDPATLPLPQRYREIWELEAACAADLGDLSGFLAAADRHSGFLADSLLRERQQRADPASKAGGNHITTDPASPVTTVASVEPAIVLDSVFARLADGTALLQLLGTENGILTWVARKDGEGVSQVVAPGRPAAKTLREARKAWSQSYLASRWRGAADPNARIDAADSLSELMDELERNWGALLRGLVDDGVTQLVLIGDDLVDIPLHAVRIGPGDDRLIDRLPVSYCPSLTVLLAGVARQPVEVARRQGLRFCSLAEADSAAADRLADILEAKPRRLGPPIDNSFWSDASAAEVLQIAARTGHNARTPLESILGPGWLGLTFSRLLAGLDLPRCDLVSILSGESVLPSILRAPGLDLASIFLAAGARNVLASTWLASDELAAGLQHSFTQRWVTGMAPAVAFRDALLHIRSERTSLTDFDWAGMRLVGAP